MIVSCAALCKDQVEREVVVFYRNGKPLLVSRSWCSPSGVPALQITGRALFSLLASLISVADYHSVDGIWYGEVAAYWGLIAAMSGMSRNTVIKSLKILMQEGFIHRHPAWSNSSPHLIRILPYNTKTGLRIFQVDPTWLRGFVVKIAPKLELFEAVASINSIEFKSLLAPVSMSRVAIRVGEAPVIVPELPGAKTSARSLDQEEDEVSKFIAEFEHIPELNGLFLFWSGMAPRMKNKPTFVRPNGGLSSAEEVDPEWKNTNWTQNGVPIKILDVELPPAATDFGVRPTWEIVGELVACEQLLRSRDQGLVAGCRPAENEQSRHSSYNDYVGPLRPNGGLSGPVDAGALANEPPAANAIFLRRPTKRKLPPETLADIHRTRGARLSKDMRLSFTTQMASCIETYELFIGVPFCEADIPHLERCLTLTSHKNVLRGIRDQSAYPSVNPGNYVVRDGMSSVFTYIEKSKFLKVKTVGRKDKVTSGLTPEFAKKLRDKKRLKAKAARDNAAVKADVAVKPLPAPGAVPPVPAPRPSVDTAHIPADAVDPIPPAAVPERDETLDPEDNS